jgi:uncharacterized RDD family membrane protein YckC
MHSGKTDEGNDFLSENVSDKKIYVGIGSRLLAEIIDSIILLPLSIVCIRVSNKSLFLFSLSSFTGALVIYLYNIVLVKKYGGTFGKLICRIKIVNKNYNNVNYKQSIIRYLYLIVLDFLKRMAMLLIAFNSRIDWGKTSGFAIYTAMQKIKIIKFIAVLDAVWIIAEIIVLLTNKKNQSIHDFVAKTYVVEK